MNTISNIRKDKYFIGKLPHLLHTKSTNGSAA